MVWIFMLLKIDDFMCRGTMLWRKIFRSKCASLKRKWRKLKNFLKLTVVQRRKVYSV